MTIKYEDAAEITTVTGWACKSCHRFYGQGSQAMHIARWCCCDERPCQAPGCTGRAEKHYTICPRCIAKKDLARYLAKPRFEWDGKTPLCSDSNHYFFDADELASWLDDLEPDELGSVRLEGCKPARKPRFDMLDLLEGYLPDGEDIDTAPIAAIVDQWIEVNVPTIWESNGQVPTPESIERHTGFRAGECKETT